MDASKLNELVNEKNQRPRPEEAGEADALANLFFARLFCETEIFICSLDSSRPLQHRLERYCFEVGR